MRDVLPPNFNPNDRSFLASAFLLANKKEGAAVVFRLQNLLDQMSLPYPQEEEFVPGSLLRADRLFLPPFGISIVVRYERIPVPIFLKNFLFGTSPGDNQHVDPVFAARQIVHDSILQPLVSISLSSGVVAEIRPGVRPFSGSSKDITAMIKNLKGEGITLRAHDAHDYGTIVHPKTGVVSHVVTNRSMVSISQYDRNSERTAPVQTDVFGDLSKKFEIAARSQNKQDWCMALAACHEIMRKPPTAQRILSASWGGVSEHVRAGELYAQNLQGHPALILQAA